MITKISSWKELTDPDQWKSTVREAQSSQSLTVEIPTSILQKPPVLGDPLRASLEHDKFKHWLEQMQMKRNPANINVRLDSSIYSTTTFYWLDLLSKNPTPTAQSGIAEGTTPQFPQITIQQGIGGGAVVGGVAGIGSFLIWQGLSNTAAMVSNPVSLGLGMVLAGVAVGSASGFLLAKFNDISVEGGLENVKVQLSQAKA